MESFLCEALSEGYMVFANGFMAVIALGEEATALWGHEHQTNLVEAMRLPR